MEEWSESTDGGPSDGLISFRGYSDAQLEELRQTIDRKRFPQNFQNLMAERDRRKADAAQPSTEAAVSLGRFSRYDGLRGWIEAIRSRSPVYGRGSIETLAEDVALHGWRRSWLGVPLQSQLIFPKTSIRNVARENATVRFDVKKAYHAMKQVAFVSESPTAAQHLVKQLPATADPEFEKRWEETRDFDARLRAVARRPLITSILVAANVLLFAAMCVSTRTFGSFTGQDLLAWGSNAGPLTVNGQWWRLLSAIFVHGNVLHLTLNMWALWNIGRLCERIFGRLTTAWLYVVTGVLASLSSVVWNPDLSSVGASGAIFGLFGAFLAFYLNSQNRVPSAIARRHWISTALFVLFNLIDGALQPGIDNAAHIGGLLAGFAIGWIVARPLEPAGRKPLRVGRAMAALVLAVLLGAAAIWQVEGIGSDMTAPEKYYRSHADLLRHQAENLQLWNALAVKAAAGSISDAELSQRFERDIVPFWQAAHDRLGLDKEPNDASVRSYALLVGEFVKFRNEWAHKLVEALKDQQPDHVAEAKDLMLKSNLAQARLERVEIRAHMAHRPRALINNPAVVSIRRLFTSTQCIVAPPAYGPEPMASDKKEDGPSARHAIGCLAQQLFLSGNYQSLDSLMNRNAHALADLPDGSSSYEGVVKGLDDLFSHGRADPLQLLGHTADWRRSVRGSPIPDVIEPMIFRASAWTARGNGDATSVSAQQWALFAYRTEMAVAALADASRSAPTDPLWYQLSLDIGLDDNQNTDQLRALFEVGHARFPQYRPLERRMMRVLMPRWGGSYAQEDTLIDGIYRETAIKRGFERYAELYTEYADLEGDDLDLFADTHAFWSGVRTGYTGLSKRYPSSDYVLNRFANMACRAGDSVQYQQLIPLMAKRFSSVAWSGKYSLETCARLLVGGAAPSAAGGDLSSSGGIVALGGIRLEAEARQLLQEKGMPIARRGNSWTYNTVDAAHNGVVTAQLSGVTDDVEAKVTGVEYVGDESSAPTELPYLIGLTESDLKEKFGYAVGMGSPAENISSLRFKDGVYADLRNGRVFRYGIYAVSAAKR